MKRHPGPSFDCEPSQTHSLEGGPADLLSRPQPVEARHLDAALSPADATFAFALEHSLASLEPRARRGALGGATGHIAESVAELVLEGLGWIPVWHFRGPGGHGVDLLMLGPGAERLLAIEVKGTLKSRRWPRLRPGELTQMGLE